MIIDSKGKIFGKINIVDIIILVSILVSIVFVGYKLSKSILSNPFNKPDKLIIKIYSEEAPEFAAKAVYLNDIVIDFDTNSTFGHVTKIDMGPSVSYAGDDKGQIIQSSKPGYTSVIYTLEGTGIYKDGVTEGGVTIDNINFYIGRTITYKVGHSIMQGRIYDIKKAE